MEIEFDAEKDASNRAKHGLSLADASRLDWATAAVILDDRKTYNEVRYRAYGRIEGRMHMLAFTVRKGAIRAISFRRANAREEIRHGERSSGPGR